ncbi:MAG: hypothetical protein GTO76_07635 [Planctomycetales bacterium]|nr:hypothetical protein [Planctomycetales bacterium]NIN08521.1 hypothetical protein [Planctomycetales bacterium]NIO46621.1 hypothetical protein [Planctomycetales bacterium]NIP04699.1 hypothetical protein [Planctomycetales bacterium]
MSTVAANIAIAAAKDATGPILLVDANLQNPSVARNFRVKSDVGFRQVLLGDISPSECVRHAGLDHLSLMLSGPILDGRQPIYSSSFTAKLLSSLKKEFHLIVFDLPPASEITSFHFLTGQVDGVLLVIEAERIRRYAARQVAQQLARSEANMLGVVFNKQRHQTTA